MIVTHAAPLRGSTITPCCRRPLEDLPDDDRVTGLRSHITCRLTWPEMLDAARDRSWPSFQEARQ